MRAHFQNLTNFFGRKAFDFAKHKGHSLLSGCVLKIDAWEDRRKVERFVSKFGVGFPVGIDNGSIFESYQTTSNVRRDLRQLSGSGEASHRR